MKDFLKIAVILIAWAVVSEMDYQDALQIERFNQANQEAQK